MKHKLSTKNKTIRREAGKILEGNAWKFFGATLLVGLVAGALPNLAIPIIEKYPEYEFIYYIVILIINIIAILLAMGIIWATIKMVDTDKYKVGTIFKPFAQRPFRNFFINFFYQLFFSIVSLLAFAIIGAVAFLTVPSLVNTIESLAANLTTGSYSALPMPDTQSLMTLSGVGLAVFIIVVLIYLFFYYRWSFVQYIPYDNNQTGVFKAFKVSKDMMKGNKFKLFRIDFYYGLLIVLFYVLSALALYLMSNVTESTLPVLILGAILAIAGVIVSIIINLRANTARALFYRLLTDEFGTLYDEKYPFLEMAPTPVEENIYHTEQRPTFDEDATAIEPGENVQTKPAANYDPDETDYSQLSSTEADPQSAAAVFTAAENPEVGNSETEETDNVSAEGSQTPSFEAYHETDTETEMATETKEFVNLAGDETGVKDAELTPEPASLVNDEVEVSKDSKTRTVDEQPDFEAYHETDIETETRSDSEEYLNLAEDETGVRDANIFQAEAVDVEEDTSTETEAVSEPSADQVNLTKDETGVDTETTTPLTNPTPITQKEETQASEKTPYTIMGYNTPSRTKFNEVENEKEVFYAADKAQIDDGSSVSFEEDEKE